MNTFRWFNRLAVLLAMMVLVEGAISCGNNSTAPTPSKTELLTRAGGWKFDKFTVGDAGAGNNLIFPDMVMKFTSSGAMTLTLTPAAVAAAKALGADVELSYTGTWSFNSAETSISFNVPPLFAAPQGVVELSSTTLRLSASNLSTMQALESQWTGN